MGRLLAFMGLSGKFFVKPEQSIEVEHREKLCNFQWLSPLILLSSILIS